MQYLPLIPVVLAPFLMPPAWAAVVIFWALAVLIIGLGGSPRRP